MVVLASAIGAASVAIANTARNAHSITRPRVLIVCPPCGRPSFCSGSLDVPRQRRARILEKAPHLAEEAGGRRPVHDPVVEGEAERGGRPDLDASADGHPPLRHPPPSQDSDL